MGFFTIIMEVENGPLEINLLFQRPLFYCYRRVHPGKMNSLLLKIGLSKRKGLSSNPHFSAASWLNCGDAVYMSVSENSGTPQIIHLNRVFHSKPSILGYPYFRKHPFVKPTQRHPQVVGCVRVTVTKEGMMKEMERLCLIMALVGWANIVAATLQGACFKTFSERQLGTCLFVGSGKVLQILPYDIQIFGEVGRFRYTFRVEIPSQQVFGCLGVMIMEERGIQNMEYQEYQ